MTDLCEPEREDSELSLLRNCSCSLILTHSTLHQSLQQKAGRMTWAERDEREQRLLS